MPRVGRSHGVGSIRLRLVIERSAHHDVKRALLGFVECLAEINLNPKLKHLPVVIYSTSLNDSVADELYEKGAYYFEDALKNKLIINDDPLLYSNLIDNLAYCKLYFAKLSLYSNVICTHRTTTILKSK